VGVRGASVLVGGEVGWGEEGFGRVGGGCRTFGFE
jgi:hypothetical protein